MSRIPLHFQLLLVLSAVVSLAAAQGAGDQCPSQDLTSPFTFVERLGIVIIVEVACLSGIFAFGLLCVVLIKSLIDPDDFKPTQDPLHVYFLSLMVSDVVQAAGAVMDAKWVAADGVAEGPFCKAQGIMKQVGDVGVALASLAIALHTLASLTFRYNPPVNSRVKWIVVASIWVIVGLLVGVGYAAANTWDYYGNTKYWCWIRREFRGEQIGLEYVYMWITATVNFIVYIPLFYSLFGRKALGRLWNRLKWWRQPKWDEDADSVEGTYSSYRFFFPEPVNPNPERPIFADIHLGGVRIAKQKRAVMITTEAAPYIDLQVTTRQFREAEIQARQMLWLPIWYFIQVLPIAVTRFLAFAGFCVPFSATLFASMVFSSSGVVNVLLFLWTRPMFLRNRVAYSEDEDVIKGVWPRGATPTPSPRPSTDSGTAYAPAGNGDGLLHPEAANNGPQPVAYPRGDYNAVPNPHAAYGVPQQPAPKPTVNNIHDTRSLGRTTASQPHTTGTLNRTHPYTTSGLPHNVTPYGARRSPPGQTVHLPGEDVADAGYPATGYDDGRVGRAPPYPPRMPTFSGNHARPLSVPIENISLTNINTNPSLNTTGADRYPPYLGAPVRPVATFSEPEEGPSSVRHRPGQQQMAAFRGGVQLEDEADTGFEHFLPPKGHRVYPTA